MKLSSTHPLFGLTLAALLAVQTPPAARADADDKPAPAAAANTNAPAGEPAGDKAAEKGGDKPAESQVKRNAEGEMVITVDSATQQRVKLEFGNPSAATWQPTVKGFGRVVDPASLTAALADWSTLQLAADGSARELNRLKTLAGQNNASARALEAAEFAAARDQLALAAGRAKFTGDWGPTLAGRADLPTLVQQLAKRKQSLVRITLPAGDTVTESGAATTLTVFPDEAHLINARLVETTLGVDPQTEGQMLLLLVEGQALPWGASVTVHINTSGSPLSGVVVPSAAVLRHEGRGWVYVRTGDDEFTRHQIPLDRLTLTGWFVTGDLSSTNVVVTTGAQTVLSAELGGGFSTGMRD
jgi:hypothetical protein